ncbi:unnamed protein product [Merluccius merluccius]
MYDEARVPSPKDAQNGVTQCVVQGAGPEAGLVTGDGSSPLMPAPRPKAEEGRLGEEEEEEEEEGDQQETKAEPVLVKKPHREILDHDRKRRVELKCMELQEMMEEQGYTEDEIQQKVNTFRQMLMDKEGVITREGSHPQPMINHLHYTHDEDDDGDPELAAYGEGDYDHYYQSDHRVKRKSSSSPSPRPKKRKKKKSGRRKSQIDGSSPARREKKKKSGKKHKRDRSTSGTRRKRRHRSGSPKNKHKDRNKQRKG